MNNFILYTGSGKFKGLMLPEEPSKPGSWAHQEFFEEYYEEKAEWRKEVERLKSEALDVVNGMDFTHSFEPANALFFDSKEDPIKPGDLFPLPKNLMFKEDFKFVAVAKGSMYKEEGSDELKPVQDTPHGVGYYKKFLRIVEAEVKEDESHTIKKYVLEKLEDISRRLKVNADECGEEKFDWFEWGVISDIVEAKLKDIKRK